MAPIIELICSNPRCKKKFQKNKASYDSQKAWGKKEFFCGNECGRLKMKIRDFSS